MIIGADHRYERRNCEDAVHLIRWRDIVIGVVADGCGSGKHTEVGAKLGVIITANQIIEELLHAAPADLSQLDWTNVTIRVEKLLRAIAEGMTDENTYSAFVFDYLLYTTVGFIMTPALTSFFGIGDGTLFVNGVGGVMEAGEGNRPDYIGYRILESQSRPVFTVYRTLATADVDHFMVATDGMRYLIGAEEKPMPNGTQPIGPVSQFWTEHRYFVNSDNIRRRFVGLNGGIHGAVDVGILRDDTAMIVGRRIPKKEIAP